MHTSRKHKTHTHAYNLSGTRKSTPILAAGYNDTNFVDDVEIQQQVNKRNYSLHQMKGWSVARDG